MSDLITEQTDWTPELLETFYEEIRIIAEDDFNISYYPNQIEIISSEQMLDAYSSVGMPIMYNHWSFGKSFSAYNNQYMRGQMGLAYEIVINSSPCIAYCMEENNMMMQALVMAHASFGHNSFFKNNYLFKQWTDAEGIINYLVYAKEFIAKCEERYGEREVEELLDSAHALQNYGVDRYKRPEKLSADLEKERTEERAEYIQRTLDEVWSKTIPTGTKSEEISDDDRFPKEPHENLLYFIEKNAPMLDNWKREVIRIVRRIAQYFYPQRQTQLMNEGWATFTHYNIMMRLHEKGKVDDGFMLAFLDSHTGVTAQPGFDSPYYSGINVYALGFAMFQDIKRVAMEPTEEDLEWFSGQEWVGAGDWVAACTYAMENFKDESFVLQYLSPKVMRDFKLFALNDDDRDDEMEIVAIHDTAGYRKVVELLADNYRLASNEANIEVWNVDRAGDRHLELRHVMHERRPLAEEDTHETLKHAMRLWEFDVHLESYNPAGDIQSRFVVGKNESMLDIFVDP
jgi:stage V sporulation protein R